MKVRFIIYMVAFVTALAVMVLLALHTHSLSAQINTLGTQVAALKSATLPHAATPDISADIPNNAIPVLAVASVSPAPVTVERNDSYPPTSANVVPVHVVTRQTTLHPGLAYDVFNDGDRPLDLRITLTSPIHLTKIFDCHVIPGKGSYCEIGFDQGFSGAHGDTLTIQALNYLPLILTP